MEIDAFGHHSKQAVVRGLIGAIATAATVGLFSGCVLAPADAKNITSFVFASQGNTGFPFAVSGFVRGQSVDAWVNFWVPITALVPTIQVSSSATVTPASGKAQNFTNPVNYTVTAQDGTSSIFTVTVHHGIAFPPLSIAGNVTTLAGSGSGVNTPEGIATDGTSLYVANAGTLTVLKVAISTGAVTTLAGGFQNPLGVATDGTYVYVSDPTLDTISKISIATGSLSVLVPSAGSPLVSPQNLAFDGTNLLVADVSAGAVFQINPSSGAVVELASSLNSPPGVATDGVNLYATIGGGSPTVVEVPNYMEASPPVTTSTSFSASGYGEPESLVSDGTKVYVADFINDQIMSQSSGASAGIVTGINPNQVSQDVDGGPTTAQFFRPVGITTDGVRLYVTDANGNSIRIVQ